MDCEDSYDYDWNLNVYVGHCQALGYEEYIFQAYGQNMITLSFPVTFVRHANFVTLQQEQQYKDYSSPTIHKKSQRTIQCSAHLRTEDVKQVLVNYFLCRDIRQSWIQDSDGKKNTWNLIVLQPIQDLRCLESIVHTIDSFIENKESFKSQHIVIVNQNVYFLKSHMTIQVIERSIAIKFTLSEILNKMNRYQNK